MLAGPINSIHGLFHHVISPCAMPSHFTQTLNIVYFPKKDWVVQRGFIYVEFVNEQVHQFTIKSSCKYTTCNLSGNCQITYHQRICTVPNLEVLKLTFGCFRGCGSPYPEAIHRAYIGVPYLHFRYRANMFVNIQSIHDTD